MTVITVLMVSSITGCTSLGLGEETEFKCNVETPDLPCTSASELYRLSESDAGVSAAWKKEQQKKKAVEDKIASDQKAANENTDGEVKEETPTPDVLLPSPEQPVAIYDPPKVARIFVAPWKDSSGALNMTSYIYMIGKEGGWSFGENGVEFADPNLHPLQVMDKDASDVMSGANDLRHSATYMTDQTMKEASEILGAGAMQGVGPSGASSYNRNPNGQSGTSAYNQNPNGQSGTSYYKRPPTQTQTQSGQSVPYDPRRPMP